MKVLVLLSVLFFSLSFQLQPKPVVSNTVRGVVNTNEWLEMVASYEYSRAQSGWDGGSAIAYVENNKIGFHMYTGERVSGENVTAQTLFNFFSGSKFVLGLLNTDMVEKGIINWNLIIARAIEEFGINGKENITFAQIASHMACMPHFNNVSITVEQSLDNTYVDSVVFNTTPICPPGSVSMYHLSNLGNIEDLIVRRFDKKRRNIQQYVNEEILTQIPINGTIIYSAGPEYTSRIAEIKGDPAPFEALPAYMCSTPGLENQCYAFRVFSEATSPFSWNDEYIRGIYAPGASMYSDPLTMAYLGNKISTKRNYEGEIDGKKWFDEYVLDQGVEEVYNGFDFMTGGISSYTRAGWEYDYFDNITVLIRDGLCGSMILTLRRDLNNGTEEEEEAMKGCLVIAPSTCHPYAGVANPMTNLIISDFFRILETKSKKRNPVSNARGKLRIFRIPVDSTKMWH